MPTGYTADIAKDISFEKFVWHCAKAFGAFVSMRDEGTDAPVPDSFEASSYNAKRLTETRDAIVALSVLSPTEIEARAEQEFQRETQAHRKYADERATLRMQYEDMLVKVKAWTPPTMEHTALRDFMIQQINDSIRGDCSDYPAPRQLPAFEWLANECKHLQRDLQYHTGEDLKERERTMQRNAWISALRGSVPVPPEMQVKSRA